MLPDISKCRACGAALLWMKTKKGRNIPVDWDVRYVDDEEFSMVAGHISHFSTCSDPDKFRKPKK